VILAHSTDVKAVLYAGGAVREAAQGRVEIYEWRGPVLHAKTAVVDGRWSTVGSSTSMLCRCDRISK